MNKENKQKRIYNDEELSQIKSMFAENEELFIAVRKLFLQMPLDAIDTSALEAAFKGSEKNKKLIRKVYLPELNPEAPIHQIIDLWMTVEVKDKVPAEVWHQLMAREKLIQYLDEQIQRIESEDFGTVKGIEFSTLVFNEKKDPNEAVEDLIVRNTIISHSENQLNQLNTLAGMKTESVEQTLERIRRDSTK
jgi:hypothetical protein